MIEPKLTMTIGGMPATARSELEVRNPATGAVFTSVPNASEQELDASVTAARGAFPAWRDMPWVKRAAIVAQMGEIIAQNAAGLAAMLTREQGKPADQAMTEIMTAAHWLRSTATLTLPDRVTETAPGRKHTTRYVPIGVVAAISPVPIFSTASAQRIRTRGSASDIPSNTSGKRPGLAMTRSTTSGTPRIERRSPP